jgi:DNA-binding transcriptional regulator YdaS (Cro superfamily)
MHEITPLDKAIQALGSQQALADALGIKSPSITGWRQSGRIPVERCAAIEAATGVRRDELRPDVFGAAPGGPDPSRRTPAALDGSDAAETDGVPVRPMSEAA